MSWFSARTEAEAVVAAEPERIWAALTDPVLLPELTPFLDSIDTDGDRWTWHLGRIPLLGVSVAPAFTVAMTFRPHERIEFVHAPPDGVRERAGTNGWYDLTEVADGTHLATSLEVEVDLPLARIASPAVTAAMRGVLKQMGDRFSRNLLQHLGLPA